MFDFELFMNACHADLETHAGDVEDYIELDSGDLSNLSDYFSDDFKAKMGAEHMDSAHLVNQLKLESFTQSMSRIALHPQLNIRILSSADCPQLASQLPFLESDRRQ